MAKNKVVNENVNNDVFSDDKLESVKKKLECLHNDNKNEFTMTKVILKLKPQIMKLRKKRVSLQRICEALETEGIHVSVSLIRHVLGPLNKREKPEEKTSD